MKNATTALNDALESECAHSMEKLLESKNGQDFSDLLNVLKSDSAIDNDKAKALYALGRWGDKAAIATIIEALPTLDEIGRVSAVDALGRLESPESLEAIEKLSNDTSPYVRKFIVQTLSRNKKAKAVKVLKAMKANEKVDFVRRYVGQ